ncbi:MAG: hypothetical protein HYT79_04370 [Elusimicrobia bacterium]|nr:hypothetical protein [Elusimicrobiota bacterium]
MQRLGPAAFFIFFICGLSSGVRSWAVESEVGYEHWDFSFFSPSRIWRVKMQELIEKGQTNYVEYIRTHRFDYRDNTYHVGYTGLSQGWGWDFKYGNTPKAAVMYRHLAQLTLYLPPPGYHLEPSITGALRRYTEAKVSTGELGLRWSPLAGWEAKAKWGRIRTELLGPVPQKKFSDSTSYQLGYMWTSALRLSMSQGSWKEFFDPGNPLNPAEYEVTERGGSFTWFFPADVQLTGAYSLERRSNDTSVKKYGVFFRQAY